MKDFLEEIGVNIAFVLAGLAGSLVTVSNKGAGEGCGCGARRDALNRMFPYDKK